MYYSGRQIRNADGSQEVSNLRLKIKVLTAASGMCLYLFRQHCKKKKEVNRTQIYSQRSN